MHVPNELSFSNDRPKDIAIHDRLVYTFSNHVNVPVHVTINMTFPLMVELAIVEFINNHYSFRLVIFAGSDTVLFVFHDITRHMVSLAGIGVGQT